MSEEQKEGLSYESSERKKKRAVSFLALEIIVFIVAVIGILMLLVYTGVIKMPDLPIFDNFNIGSQNDRIITASSSIPGYSITLKNEEKLVELLNSWGLFGREYGPTYGAAGNTAGEPLKKINIHLTNEPQGTNAFGRSNQDIYSSSLTQVSPGLFDVYIYIDEGTLNNEYAGFDPNTIMRTSFLSSIYKIINPFKDPQESAKVEQDLYDELMNNPLVQQDYFEIKRN